MSGMVATSRSTPFRYVRREMTTIVTKQRVQSVLGKRADNLLVSVSGGVSAGLNWSAMMALGMT